MLDKLQTHEILCSATPLKCFSAYYNPTTHLLIVQMNSESIHQGHRDILYYKIYMKLDLKLVFSLFKVLVYITQKETGTDEL